MGRCAMWQPLDRMGRLGWTCLWVRSVTKEQIALSPKPTAQTSSMEMSVPLGSRGTNFPETASDSEGDANAALTNPVLEKHYSRG
jgi:hypothetical protein